MKCELCEREVFLTTHHLLCKSQWSKKSIQRKFSKKEMHNRTIEICKLCHSGLHDLYDEKYLTKSLNTKELLLADVAIQNMVQWCKKQK